jgi:hypothetical protein
MKFETQEKVLLVAIFSLANVHGSEKQQREKKHFSLFSVVSFKNEECSSKTTFTGGTTHGTCYSATECSTKKGTKSGNCASGFGVCCVFVSKTGATATIKENRTYIRNPLYPAVETATPTSSITWTLNKMQSDICQIRLDFDNFVIGGPANSIESGTDGAKTNCKDTLTTTLSSNYQVPVLCGVMTGEHLYLDIGAASTDKATLAMAFATETVLPVANAMRSWSIKTSQIPCWATYRAPDGCHRYFTQSTGQIISPNFKKLAAESTTRATTNILSGLDLLSQHLKICLRREKGMCCTRFNVCVQYDGIDLISQIAGGIVTNGGTGSISEGWSFHTDYSNTPQGVPAGDAAHVDQGVVDAACTSDYVEIPDSSTGMKNFASAVQVNTRYCGSKFGYAPAISAATYVSAPVYECTEPWEVYYHTDQYSDEGGVAAAATTGAPTIESRGLCLDFVQEAC